MGKEEFKTAFSQMSATTLAGNVTVGAVVIMALLTLKSWPVLLGLLALPSLWTSLKTGDDKDDKQNERDG